MSGPMITNLLQYPVSAANAVGIQVPGVKKCCCAGCYNNVVNPSHTMCHTCWSKVQVTGNAKCTKCQTGQANPGRAWCQQCYKASKNQRGQHTNNNNGNTVQQQHQQLQQHPQHQHQQQYQQQYQQHQHPQLQPSSPAYHNHQHAHSQYGQQGYGGPSNYNRGGYNPHGAAGAAPPPPQQHSGFCRRCGRPSGGAPLCQGCLSHGPVVLELSPTDAKYGSIMQQFTTQWQAGSKNLPNIIKILSVYNSPLHARYTSYAQRIAQQNHGDANERRVFHGCSIECPMPTANQICTSPTCIVCQICTSGFKRKPSKYCNLQFGPGFYFAYHSFKADCYAPAHHGVKALLMCKVVMGKVQKLYQDEKHRTSPDAGFHSVIGEPGVSTTLWKGVAEAVVYDEAAILPAYIILYRP